MTAPRRGDGDEEVRLMKMVTVAVITFLLVGCGPSPEGTSAPGAAAQPASGQPASAQPASARDTSSQDAATLAGILDDIRRGWEQGDGAPFYKHFLDWEGARYFEGGGENRGLRDLVEHHVEPEAKLGLRLGFSNIQTHVEGDFAWAVVDTEIRLTTADGRDIHNRGHGTYLFRRIDGTWKVVHTQSASSPVKPK